MCYNEDTKIKKGAKRPLLLGIFRNIKNLYPNNIVIGITKPNKIPVNYKELVYITPTISDCKRVIDAGADIVALDGTMSKRPNDEKLEDLVKFIKLFKVFSHPIP